MRILERCTSAWPVPEMQSQIESLREAFSADTSRPFELKRSFPFGSPISAGLQPSPPLDANTHHPILTRHESVTPMPYQTTPMTPPISASLGFEESKEKAFSTASMPIPHGNLPVQTLMGSGQVEWNPTPIIKYVAPASGTIYH